MAVAFNKTYDSKLRQSIFLVSDLINNCVLKVLFVKLYKNKQGIGQICNMLIWSFTVFKMLRLQIHGFILHVQREVFR